MRRARRALARALAAALALASLLVPLRAPTYALWKLRVGVTEWGHYPGALAALLLLLRATRRMIGPLWPLAGLGALTMLSSAARAWRIARRLPGDLDQAYGRALTQPRRAALSWRALLLGVRLRRARPERHIYAHYAGRDLVIDLYRAAGGGPAPLVLVVHGGAWQSGDSTQLSDLNHYLAARGYAVAAITYRLAPEHRFPAAHEDVCAALRFCQSRAAEFGVDPGRVVLLGRSAGGHLALLAAYALSDPAIRGAVAFYAPTDMRFGYALPANPRVIDSKGVLRDFLGGSPDEAPDQYDAASPLGVASAESPATLMIHGAADDLVSVRNSRRLAARLAALGRPHLLLELPWATHGCDANLGGPSGQLATYAIERFLAAALR